MVQAKIALRRLDKGSSGLSILVVSTFVLSSFAVSMTMPLDKIESSSLASSPWPMFRHDLDHTGRSSYDTSQNSGDLMWKFTTGKRIESSAVIGPDNTIYIGSWDGKMYAIDPDGNQLWNYSIGQFGAVTSTPAISSDNAIYFGSYDSNIYALFLNGTLKWNFSTDSAVLSSPAIAPDGTIYVGSADYNLYAIYPGGTIKWKFPTGYWVDSSPAIGVDGTIYVGSDDGDFYAVNPNGTLRWNFTTGSKVDSSPAIASDGTVYVGSGDHNLYALNPDGTLKWNYTTDAEIWSSPAIGSDGTVYVGSGDHNLYALNPDGTLKWNYTADGLISSSPAIGSEGTIYIGSYDGNLYAIHPNGTLKWKFKTEAWVHSTPAMGPDGTVYVGSLDGCLYAVGQEGTNQPPVADAGPDQTVYEGDTVQFNGSGSRGSSSHTTLTFGRNVWVTEGTDSLAFLDVAAHGKDEVYVAYETFPMGAMDVYLSRSIDGGSSFEEGRVVHEKKEGAQGSPAVTVDDNGTVYVVWDQNRTPPLYEDNLFLAKSTDRGLNFTEGIMINQNTAVSSLALPSSIAVGQSGNIYAVWHGWIDPSEIEIYFSRSTDGGMTFDPEVRVDDDVAPWAKLCPDVALGPNEEIYVVWMEQRKTNDWDIFLSKSSDNGVSFGQDVLVNRNVTFRNETYPSISVDEKGRILVVYGANNGTSDQIFLAFSGDGGLSFDEIQVTNESIRWRSFPQVATYRHILYLIWQGGDWPVGRSDIYFSFTADGVGNLSLPVRVNDAPTNLSHLDPSMDVDAVGNVHITWRDNRQGLLAAYYAKGNLTLGDSDMVSCEWDFDASIDSDGDGNHTNDVDGTGPTPTHVYGDDGIYTVTLTVKDEYGANDSDTMNVTVINAPPGTTDPVIFGHGDEGSPVWGLTGDAIDPGSDDLIFEWDYGDGTSETNVYYNDGASPEPTYDPTTNEIKSPWGVFPFSVSDRSDHIYGDNGVYPVSLTISDDDGGVVVFSTADSTIENVPPILSANVPSIVDEGDAILFSANAVDNGTDDLTFIWDWGDGTPASITTHYNNAPINTPDPYPSPWGTYPFSASDSVSHIYGDDGSYVLTLIVEDDDGGVTSYQKTITVLNVNPTVNINGPYSGDENTEIHFSADATDPGSDDLTFKWEFEYGPTITSVYYNDGVNPDPPQSPWGTFPYSASDTVSHVYGDNGNFTVTLTVIDDDGGVTTQQTVVVVENVAPSIDSMKYYLNASFAFRIAGEKWHNVEIHLYEDGTEIGYANITRFPGSPNNQMVTLADVSIDFSKTYSAVAYYTPEDVPINGQIWGATPAWVILEYEDGEERIHHTFNVRHEDTWTWVIDDLSPYFLGHNITFMATASDPGSDDHTFTWNWGDGNMTEHVYYNDGVGPDPYPSPEVNPIAVTDTVRHGYASAGTYVITLTVTDDDGGITSYSLNLTL